MIQHQQLLLLPVVFIATQYDHVASAYTQLLLPHGRCTGTFGDIRNVRSNHFHKQSHPSSTSSNLNMLLDQPDWIASAVTKTATMATITDLSSIEATSSQLLLAFSDQGQNLAGIFFQASLLPYLLFLYFLSFRANRISDLANFGFQFVLIFVISTIPSGIISKSIYGYSLADTDWLHGGAESLLTMANILIVLGLKQAMTEENPPKMDVGRNVALGVAALFVTAMAIGPSMLQLEGHTPFLLGAGNLPTDFVQSFEFVSHTEPTNALSIPTWAIHFSSVIEYVFAMSLVWDYAETTRNPKWKGLTWGMLPLHASGICACTYHFFYNPSSLQFLVTSQAGLTLLGNITLMIAAFRIAASNGWTLNELNPLPRPPTSPIGLVADGIAAMPLEVRNPQDMNLDDSAILATKLLAVTFALSYAVKYGELGIDLPFSPNPIIATSIVVAVPAITAYNFYRKSQIEGGLAEPLTIPFFQKNGDNESGGPSISMADVKKYGVAGTVAYILTELAFWIVAFPVAATALYESTGHWPDVVNEVNDRTAVLAFIFAGANIARLLVPLRFGAALALAPWVDTNIIRRLQKEA
jgi:Protein of unknown function (DUF2499)/Protein of unknown function (DUF3593)